MLKAPVVKDPVTAIMGVATTFVFALGVVCPIGLILLVLEPTSRCNQGIEVWLKGVAAWKIALAVSQKNSTSLRQGSKAPQTKPKEENTILKSNAPRHTPNTQG